MVCGARSTVYGSSPTPAGGQWHSQADLGLSAIQVRQSAIWNAFACGVEEATRTPKISRGVTGISPSLPADRFGSAYTPARRSGRAGWFGGWDDRSGGSGENAEKRSSDGLRIVFGENRGSPWGDCPPRGLPNRHWGRGVDKGQATRLPGDAEAGRVAVAPVQGRKIGLSRSFRFPRKASFLRWRT
jgi:hypothetical protein